MKKNLVLAGRVILGLLFVVFGLNFFFNFLPPQPPVPEAGQNFLGALFATGYMFPVIKTIEISSGLLILSGIAVPLALVLLSPIVVNIVLFHTVLAPAPGLPALIVVLMLFLAWNYRGNFRNLFIKERLE